jgi:signal recognition particle subunit SRP72
MAAAGVVNNLPSLFAELSRLGEKGEYEKALRVVNKILQDAPEDEKAFHCKMVCLVQLGKFDEALGAMRKNPKLSASLVFEKAYCEYRLNRSDEALRTIRSVADIDMRTKELLGQVLYRLENYSECFSTYRDLLKNSEDDYEDERETNLSAVMASLQLWQRERREPIVERGHT